MSDTLTTIEGAAGAAQFIGTNLARFYGGEMGRAAATFLLGEASWTASTTDLVAKLQDGTTSGGMSDKRDLSLITVRASHGH